jgi:hypothetical protein
VVFHLANIFINGVVKFSEGLYHVGFNTVEMPVDAHNEHTSELKLQ